MQQSFSVNYERLEKLADHLLHGKIGHEVFLFGSINGGDFLKGKYTDKRLRACRVYGGPIGECPFVFEEWFFDGYGEPMISSVPEGAAVKYSTSAMIWFSISEEANRHLFYPRSQISRLYNNCFDGIYLGHDAPKEKVAENIYRFIRACKTNPFSEKIALGK